MSDSPDKFERDSKVANNPAYDSPDQLDDPYYHLLEDPLAAIEDFHQQSLSLPTTHGEPNPSQAIFPEEQTDNTSYTKHLEGQYGQPSTAEFVQIPHTTAQLPSTEMLTVPHTAVGAHTSPVTPLVNVSHPVHSVPTFPGPYEQQDLDEDVLRIHPSEFSTAVPSATENITTTDHQVNPRPEKPEDVLEHNTQDSVRRSLRAARTIQKRRTSDQRQTRAAHKAHVRREMALPIPHGNLHEQQQITLAEETEQQARDPYVPERNTEPVSSGLVIESHDGEAAISENVPAQEENLLEYAGAPDLGDQFDRYKFITMAREKARDKKLETRGQLKEELKMRLQELERQGTPMDAKKKEQERSKRESQVTRIYNAAYIEELEKYAIATAILEVERDYWRAEAQKCQEETQKCREEAQKCREEAQSFQSQAEWLSQFAPSYGENENVNCTPAQSTDASEDALE